jgi:MT0933-like antitoxin protein
MQGADMSEFRGAEQKAESLAREHPDKVDKGIDEAAQFAEHKTGDKYDSEIQHAAGAAEKHFGGEEPAQDQAGQDEKGQG